jgi:hypothetical protein
MEQPSLVQDTFRQAAFESTVHCLFGGTDSGQVVLCDRIGETQCLLHEVILRRDDYKRVP